MTAVAVQEPPLTRSDLCEELDRTLKRCGTRAEVADLKVWSAGLLLVVVLSVVGTVGAIVVGLLARYVAAPTLILEGLTFYFRILLEVALGECLHCSQC